MRSLLKLLTARCAGADGAACGGMTGASDGPAVTGGGGATTGWSGNSMNFTCLRLPAAQPAPLVFLRLLSCAMQETSAVAAPHLVRHFSLSSPAPVPRILEFCCFSDTIALPP